MCILCACYVYFMCFLCAFLCAKVLSTPPFASAPPCAREPRCACVLPGSSIPGTNKITWSGHLQHLPVDDPGRRNTPSGEPETRPVPPQRTRALREERAREYEELLASGTAKERDAHYQRHGQGILDPFSRLLPCPFINLVGSMHAVCTDNVLLCA